MVFVRRKERVQERQMSMGRGKCNGRVGARALGRVWELFDL